METQESLQKKIDAAVKSGNKQVANQLKQKLQKLEKPTSPTPQSRKPGKPKPAPRSNPNVARTGGNDRTKGNPKGYLTDVNAYNIPGNITVKGSEAYPQPRLYKTATGRSLSTEPIRSYYQTDLPLVWIPNQSVVGLLYSTTSPGFLQIGSNPDASVSAFLNQSIVNLYYQITRALSSVGGPVNFDLTIANPDATHTYALSYYLYHYSQAYCILRACLGMLSAGNLNAATSKLAASVMINYDVLLTWLIELRTYPMCQEWCNMLDMWSGAFIGGEDDPVIYGGIPQATNVDLTVSTNMLDLINTAGVAIGQLAFPNAALVDVPSMLKVQRVLSIAYGSPTYSDSKPVISDLCAYTTMKAQMITFRDATDHLTFSWPNYNNTQDVTFIPMVVPSGYDGPYLKYSSSLLRPVVYSADPIAGLTDAALPNQVGLFCNTSTNATNAIWYDQTTGFHVSTSQQAGFYSYSYQDVETELEYWVSEGGLHVTNYTTDHRSFSMLDLVWTPNQVFTTETVWIIADMFLNPLSSGGRQSEPLT